MDVILGETVGEYNTDGSVKDPAWRCAFTGQYIAGIHSNCERVEGTRYFYRVAANDLHRVTDEWRAEFAAAVKSAFEAKPVVRDLRRPDKTEPKVEA